MLEQKDDKELLYLGMPATFLKVRGTISPIGSYGHLGVYDREIKVQYVIDWRVASEEEISRCDP